MITPDYFQPKIVTDGLMAKLFVIAWDKNGVEVPLALGCRLSGNAQADNQMLDMLKQSAWQAVWLTAQTDSTNPANSLFTPQPDEVPIFSEDQPSLGLPHVKAEGAERCQVCGCPVNDFETQPCK